VQVGSLKLEFILTPRMDFFLAILTEFLMQGWNIKLVHLFNIGDLEGNGLSKQIPHNHPQFWAYDVGASPFLTFKTLHKYGNSHFFPHP
jgi:hypothetical protein